ncbi:hypothetical protein RUND412_007987 [Rhizina undulata]
MYAFEKTSRNSRSPSNCHFIKNQNFCGRGFIIDELHQILQSSPSSASGDVSDARRTAILYGLGGVGKSQIALEYAHCERFSRGYTSIFWLDADSDFHTKQTAFEVLKQLVVHYAKQWNSSPDYSIIANTLGIPGEIDDSGRILPSAVEGALEVVHGWLEKGENRGCLLLVDNKDREGESLIGFFRHVIGDVLL